MVPLGVSRGTSLYESQSKDEKAIDYERTPMAAGDSRRCLGHWPMKSCDTTYGNEGSHESRKALVGSSK
jgi:hypothetical protein